MAVRARVVCAVYMYCRPEGQLLSLEIAATRERLGLDEVLGCADRRYRRTADHAAEDSLWGLYMRRVRPGPPPPPNVLCTGCPAQVGGHARRLPDTSMRGAGVRGVAV